MEGEMDSFFYWHDIYRHYIIISFWEGLCRNTIQVTGKCFGATK